MSKIYSKIYVVKNGRQTGVFHNWNEVEESVKGFSGADYQGFNSIFAAFAYNKCEDAEEAINLLNAAVAELEVVAKREASKTVAPAPKSTPAHAQAVTFVPTKGQQKVLDNIVPFVKSDNIAIAVVGYAGTGKTTIIRPIAKLAKDECDMETFVASLTNKAAYVAKDKLGDVASDCSTIHKILYDFDDLTHQSKLNELKFPERALVVIDESSMISDEPGKGTKMISDLLAMAKRNHCKLIFLGDPFQLPPVKSGSKTIWDFNFPTFWLTEVMRQKEQSVLAMATSTRSLQRVTMLQQGIKVFGNIYQGSKDVLFSNYCEKYVENKGDQVGIVWRNSTRLKMTREVRAKLRFSGVLNPDEPIISIANSHDMANGDMALVESCSVIKEVTLQDKSGNEVKAVAMKVNNMKVLFIPEAKQSSIYHQSFDSHSLSCLPHSFVETCGRWLNLAKEVVIATYGYFITAHKAQGGEWHRVYVFETPLLFDSRASREEIQVYAARGFYTAITRTSSILLIADTLKSAPNAVLGTPQDMVGEMEKYLSR